uniref:Uncharacterized protein n=1 Tax=Oryza rufipogon TaxID=4529 RepID=A0A0E0MUI4_ORYRU
MSACDREREISFASFGFKRPMMGRGKSTATTANVPVMSACDREREVSFASFGLKEQRQRMCLWNVPMMECFLWVQEQRQRMCLWNVPIIEREVGVCLLWVQEQRQRMWTNARAGKSVFASKNLWFKSNGSSNGVRKDERRRRRGSNRGDGGEGSSVFASKSNGNECGQMPARASNDSGEVAVEWYAKRDIDRASEFIDRVHRGMLTDASGEQDG